MRSLLYREDNRALPCCHSDLKLPASSAVRNKFLLFKSYSVYCTFYITAWTKAGVIHGVSVATSDAIKTLCVSISQLYSQLHCCFSHSHASKMAIIKFKFQVQGKERTLPLNSCGKTFHVVALQIWWDISFSKPESHAPPWSFSQLHSNTWIENGKEWWPWYSHQKKETWTLRVEQGITNVYNCYFPKCLSTNNTLHDFPHTFQLSGTIVIWHL